MRTRTRWIGLSVAMLGLVIGAPSRADTIVDFTYSGTAPGSAASGTGSFSFSSNLTTVPLSSLTSFSFTNTASDLTFGVSSIFTYGLSDLKTFSATVGPGPTLTTLTLSTDFVSGTRTNFFPESFTITSLSSGGGMTQSSLFGQPTNVTTGSVTITSIGTPTAVPEPSNTIVAVFGAVAFIAYDRSRHRRG